MSGEAVVVAIVIIAAAAATGTQRWFADRRARRALRSATALAPTTPEGGTTRVTGRVRIAKQVFDAPLSARRCVAYRVRVFGSTGLISDRPLRYEEAQTVPFVIERPDGTRVEIATTHATLDLPYLALPADSDDRCLALVQRAAIVNPGIAKLTFEEVVVMEGMRVSVAGLLMKDASLDPAASERGFREDQPPAMRLAGDAKHPVIVGVPVE
jgi:hypothetical protein